MGNGLFSSYSDSRGYNFLSFWLGPASSGIDMHFPSCSDELLDWCQETTEILRLYLQKGISRQIDDTRSGRSTPCKKLIVRPVVLNNSVGQYQHLSSMSLIERVQFLAENVLIIVSESEESPAIMTLKSFSKIHSLLNRYLELLVTMKAKTPEKASHFCSICLDDDSKLVVLPCSHSLCTTCNQRWVNRRLNCPFCRLDFDRRSLNRNQWEMTEWQAKDAVEDIVRLEIEIGRLYDSFEFLDENVELLSAYSPIERLLEIYDENGIILVNEQKL